MSMGGMGGRPGGGGGGGGGRGGGYGGPGGGFGSGSDRKYSLTIGAQAQECVRSTGWREPPDRWGEAEQEVVDDEAPGE